MTSTASSPTKRSLRVVLLATVVALVSACGATNSASPASRGNDATVITASSSPATDAPTAGTHYQAVVTRVVDGDTIVVRYLDGRTDKVRLLGVNTPETHKPNWPIECFGPEAEQFTRSKLNGKTITLELDRQARDKYRRLLAYVYLDGRRFDDELLRQGFARLMVIRPNGTYAKAMLSLQLKAQQLRVGLWGQCG